MAKKSSQVNPGETAKPTSAAAVIAALAAVTLAVPNLSITRWESKLEIMVPPEIIMDTIPALPTGTANSRCIMGQDEPSSESGSPKLINAT